MIRALCDEVATILRRPWELVLMLVLPPLAMVTMGAMLIGGTVRHTPVGLVDDSHSALGRSVLRALAASSDLSVEMSSGNLEQAWARLRRADLYAVVYLPPDFERRARARTPDAVLIYENASFYTAASLAGRKITAALGDRLKAFAPRLLGLPEEVGTALSGHRPAAPQVQVSFVGNPQLSLELFLGSLIVPGVLLLLASCAAIGAVSREMLEKRPQPWAMASPWALLVARLAPTVVIFTLWLMVWTVWLGAVRGFHPVGSVIEIVAAEALLMVATCSIAALLVGAAGDPDSAYSASTVYAGSSIAFSNATLPLVHGPLFAQWVSSAIPLSHYIRIQNGQWTLGMPLAANLGDFALLAGYAVIPLLVAAPLLRWRSRKPGKEEKVPPAALNDTGFWRSYVDTVASMVRSKPLFSLFLLSVALYAFYYPSAYVGQTAHDLPVGVLDQEHDRFSRELIRHLDATEAVAVTRISGDPVEATRWLAAGRVMALLDIPPDFSRRLGRLDAPGLALSTDGGYPTRASFVGGAVTSALPPAIRQTAQDVLGMTLPRADGTTGQAFAVTTLPMFNTTNGYGSYAVPGVMSIILQQTLLFGTATLAGFRREAWAERRRRGRPGWKMSWPHFLGLWTALTVVGFCTNAFYWGFVLWFQDFPRGGNIAGAAFLGGWFAAAVSGLGLLVGSLFDRHDRAVYILAGTSVPLFFLGGLAIPHFAMPGWLVALAWPVPSTVAIPAFVEINGAGASLAEIAPYTLTMIVLALLYGALAGWRWCGPSWRATPRSR